MCFAEHPLFWTCRFPLMWLTWLWWGCRSGCVSLVALGVVWQVPLVCLSFDNVTFESLPGYEPTQFLCGENAYFSLVIRCWELLEAV